MMIDTDTFHVAFAFGACAKPTKTEDRESSGGYNGIALQYRSSKKKFYDNFPSRMHSVA